MVFQKTAGKRRLVDTRKTQKSEGCEPHSILPKFQNRREATPRRYLQNFKNRGDATFQVDIHNPNSKKKNKNKGSKKTSNFKNRGEATFHRYPQNKIFEEKQGSDA